MVDRHINHISVITIVHWMFTGVKKRYLGIFPKPGVSDKDIVDSVKFGEVILLALKHNNFTNLQENLLLKGAVEIKSFLLTVDKRANVIFSKWANLIYKKEKTKDSNRQIWIKMFSFYLNFAIWFVAPIVFMLYLLSYPFLYKKIKKDKKYYSLTKSR